MNSRLWAVGHQTCLRRSYRGGLISWCPRRRTSGRHAQRRGFNRLHSRAIHLPAFMLPVGADLNLWRLAQRLVDDAVALSQPNQRGKLLFARVGVQVEVEVNLLETDQRLL